MPVFFVNLYLNFYLMRVAVVGATGLVGSKMLQVLEERNFPVDELLPVASERSIGKQIEFKGKKYNIISALIENYFISNEQFSGFELARAKQDLKAHQKFGKQIFLLK